MSQYIYKVCMLMHVRITEKHIYLNLGFLLLLYMTLQPLSVRLQEASVHSIHGGIYSCPCTQPSFPVNSSYGSVLVYQCVADMLSLAYLLVFDSPALLQDTVLLFLCFFFCYLTYLPFAIQLLACPNHFNCLISSRYIRDSTLKFSYHFISNAISPCFLIICLRNLISTIILLTCLSKIVQLSAMYIIIGNYTVLNICSFAFLPIAFFSYKCIQDPDLSLQIVGILNGQIPSQPCQPQVHKRAMTGTPQNPWGLPPKRVDFPAQLECHLGYCIRSFHSLPMLYQFLRKRVVRKVNIPSPRML